MTFTAASVVPVVAVGPRRVDQLPLVVSVSAVLVPAVEYSMASMPRTTSPRRTPVSAADGAPAVDPAVIEPRSPAVPRQCSITIAALVDGWFQVRTFVPAAQAVVIFDQKAMPTMPANAVEVPAGEAR